MTNDSWGYRLVHIDAGDEGHILAVGIVRYNEEGEIAELETDLAVPSSELHRGELDEWRAKEELRLSLSRMLDAFNLPIVESTFVESDDDEAGDELNEQGETAET